MVVEKLTLLGPGFGRMITLDGLGVKNSNN